MKNEFDNKLTDRGWRSMRRLLDREMPEQRRRRYVIWWPFALLLLSLAGAGGRWWYQAANRPAPAAPVAAPKMTAPVVTTGGGVSVPVEIAGTANSGPGAGNDAKSGIDRQANGTVERRSVKETSREAGTAERRSAQAIREAAFRDPGIAGGGKPALPQAVQPFGENKKIVASSLALVYPAEAIEMNNGDTPALSAPDAFYFEKIKPLPPLNAQKSIVAQTVTASEGCLVGSTVKKHKNTPRWSLGLFAGLASETFSALNGISAGAAVNWQFARRWGVRSGLQYAHYRLSTDQRPVVSLAGLDYTKATGTIVQNSNSSGGGSTPASSASTTVLVPVERLRQLEMPVLAYWQPLRPLRVFAGVSVAYTLSSQASQLNYANNNQVYEASDPSALKNLNALATDKLPRLKTNWQVGAGYRIGRHFELDAFYRNNLGNNPATTDAANLDAYGGFIPDASSGSKGSSHYFLLNGIWFF